MTAGRRFFVITGCSGGGKSTLVDALEEAGQHVVREPGRRIIANGGPLPWEDLAGFCRAAIAMAEADYDAAKDLRGPVFFDRGLVDAVFALAHATQTSPELSRLRKRPYDQRVFIAPPWAELFEQDAVRRHSVSDAIAEYHRLAEAYPTLGHSVFQLPFAPVESRVDFILRTIAQSSRNGG